MNYFLSIPLISVAFLFATCTEPKKNSKPEPIDKKATTETLALFNNLKKLSGKHILFGQQDATAYGVHNKDTVRGFCDMHEVTGQFPALYGFDIGHINQTHNVDSVSFIKIEQLIKEAYARGGVITISWHEKNPVSNGKIGDLTPAVKRILPGGDFHSNFKKQLDLVGRFFLKLKDASGKPIPVIFRPYHEHNGDWFWWGTKGCTEQEYAELFRFTVEYLRDTMNIHQLLYAISPDRSRMDPKNMEQGMLYAYPGDAYVDIFGMDNYWDVGASANYDKNQTRAAQDSLFAESLLTLTKIADKKNKIAALTETGNNALKEHDWYSKRLIKPLENYPQLHKIAYIMVWRNANENHFYVPFSGHPATADFIQFMNHELILFENELPKMYQ